MDDAEKQKSLVVSANVVEVPAEAASSADGAAQEADEIIIDFEPDDPSNPHNWPAKRKWTIVVLLMLLSVLVNLAIIACAPAVPDILDEFDTHSFASQTLIISIWQLGELVGPLISASLSEVYGRSPVLNASNVCFAVFLAACGLSRSIHALLLFRFLTGFSTITGTMNQPILADMFEPRQRPKAAMMVQIPALLAIVVGPTLGSYFTLAEGWRWTFWLLSIFAGVCALLFFVFYRETYKVAILAAKARRVARERKNGDGDGVRVRSKYDDGDRMRAVVLKAFIRPVQMLVLCPAVTLVAVNVAFVYGCLYLVFASIAQVFRDQYRFSQGVLGLAYLGLGIGMMIGMLGGRRVLDVYYRRSVGEKKASGLAVAPEVRIPPIIAGSVLLPVGFFVYGWTAEAQTHYIVPIIMTSLIGMAFLATNIPSSIYLMDGFGIYTASASAAVNILKFSSGTVLPLAGPALYNRLGVGWGNSVLGFIALALIPIPICLMLFGSKMRTSWSGFKTRE